MKRSITAIIEGALTRARKEGALSTGVDVAVEKPKREEFGDFSTNAAMLLAKAEGKAPREVAEALLPFIKEDARIKGCEVAGPGFINIFVEDSFWSALLAEVLKKGDSYGELDIGKGKKILLEFVSANPTGPLHIGHGRGAAVGDALARVLKAAGFKVTREYYINDVGNQMEMLGESVRLRLEELGGAEVTLTDDHYKGEYIKDIAREYRDKYGTEEAGSTPTFTAFAAGTILEGIKKDLADFGVEFDEWFAESELDEEGLVEDTLKELKDKGHTYVKDGATWFKTEPLGDDKDRVLKKSDKKRTYFAADTAFHREKLKRGFDTLVNIWGSDHHGYEGRIRALLKALGEDDKKLKVIFIQLVSLSRGGVPVAMSTRGGEFVTLREVTDEVGTDACRFFFLMRRSDAQLDFDLELAKKQAPENPVYYVQYCFARVMSIMAFAGESGLKVPEIGGAGAPPPPGGPVETDILDKLEEKQERDIIKHLGSFEEVVERAALEFEPHKVTFYLQELAGLFHPYYNANRVVTDDKALSVARLHLCAAVATVVKKGLTLLGVNAPSKM